MFRKAWIGLIWGVPWLAAAAPGTVSLPAELRTAPRAAAEVLRTLPAGTAVDIQHRSGGWYQVQVDQQQGWVRLAALRLPAAPAPDKAAATGLKFADLQKGAVDLQAVSALDAGAPDADDARDFAGRGGLEARGIGKAPRQSDQTDQTEQDDGDKDQGGPR
jgi:hypothetical protein